MTDERDLVGTVGPHGDADPAPEEIRESAAKTTDCVGKILVDLQLEAEGKLDKDNGQVQEKLGGAEQRVEDER
jgi:uncharacterized protein YjbJ (UPF0337 family)